MFNTLKYARMLERVGFSKEQAETSIQILMEIMETKLATKEDILNTKETILSLEQGLEHKLEILKSDLTIRMGTMLAASIAILTALDKLI